MINDEICKLRDELNKSIEEGQDYKIIYQISIELDEKIAKFYSQGKRRPTKRSKKNTKNKALVLL